MTGFMTVCLPSSDGATSGNSSKTLPDPFVVTDSLAAAYADMSADKARDVVARAA
jgi:hypothetical protein